MVPRHSERHHRFPVYGTLLMWNIVAVIVFPGMGVLLVNIEKGKRWDSLDQSGDQKDIFTGLVRGFCPEDEERRTPLLQSGPRSMCRDFGFL